MNDTRRIVVLTNTIAHNAPQNDAVPSLESQLELNETTRAIAHALSLHGWEVSIVEVSTSVAHLATLLAPYQPDVVFNIVEALDGDDLRGHEAAQMLAQLGIPFTGINAELFALTSKKELTRAVLQHHGVRMPAGYVISTIADLDAVNLTFPVIVKPAHAHASVGISQQSVVRDATALRAQVAFLQHHITGPVIVEQFINGPEFTAALITNPATSEAYIKTLDYSKLDSTYFPIVSYDCKWTESAYEYNNIFVVPVDSGFSATARTAINDIAHAAVNALGIISYVSFDIRMDDAGTPYIIDVNPNCDLHLDAGMAKVAGFAGISYDMFIHAIALDALERAR